MPKVVPVNFTVPNNIVTYPACACRPHNPRTRAVQKLYHRRKFAVTHPPAMEWEQHCGSKFRDISHSTTAVMTYNVLPNGDCECWIDGWESTKGCKQSPLHLVPMQCDGESAVVKAVPLPDIPGYSHSSFPRLQRWGLLFFEVITLLLATFDVVSDILVLVEYHTQGLQGWLVTSLVLMVISNLLLTTATILAMHLFTDDELGHFGRIGGVVADWDFASVKFIALCVCLLPLGQFLPLIGWAIDKLFPSEPKICHLPQGKRQRDNSQQSAHIADKLFKSHFLFFTETLVESIPQSIVQLIVIMLHSEAVTTVQVVSLCLSLLSICSKMYQVVRTTDVYMFLGAQLLLISDVLILFFMYLSLFAPGPFIIGTTFDLFFLDGVNVFAYGWWLKHLITAGIMLTITVPAAVLLVYEDTKNRGITMGLVCTVFCMILFGIVVGPIIGIALLLLADWPRFTFVVFLFYVTGALHIERTQSHKLLNFVGIKDAAIRMLTRHMTFSYQWKTRFINAFQYDSVLAYSLQKQPFGKSSVGYTANKLWRDAQCAVCRAQINAGVCQTTDEWAASKLTKAVNNVSADDKLWCLGCCNSNPPQSQTYVCLDPLVAWCHYQSIQFRTSPNPHKARKPSQFEQIRKSLPFPLKYINVVPTTRTFINTLSNFTFNKQDLPGDIALVGCYFLFFLQFIVQVYTTILPVLLAIVLKKWTMLHLLTGVTAIVSLFFGVVLIVPRGLLYYTIIKDTYEGDPIPTRDVRFCALLPQMINEYYSQCHVISLVPILTKTRIPWDVVRQVLEFTTRYDVLIGSKTERKLLTDRFVESNILPFDQFFPPAFPWMPHCVINQKSKFQLATPNPCPMHGTPPKPDEE